MVSNLKKDYAVLVSNLKSLGDSLIKVMNKNVKDAECKKLIRDIKKYKRNLLKASCLLNIILFYLTS